MHKSPEQNRDDPRIGLVAEIVEEALGTPATEIVLLVEQGNVNRTYSIATRNGNFILRARFDRNEMRQFICEQQCADLIRKVHDWTPAVVAVGRYGDHCYSIQEEIPGVVASRYPGDMIEVWEQIGQYSKFFHDIRTSGYLFDLFREGPLPEGLWCQRYFDGLGEASSSKLVTRGLLTQGEFESAFEALQPLKNLAFEPTLAHGNLTPKNIMVGPSGKAHIIDWGTCQGHLAIDLDISELFVFGTPPEHVQAYLRGHRLPNDYVEQNFDLIHRLQLVRLFTTANWLCATESSRKNDLANYVAGVKSIVGRLRS
jgi:fructosamine-3-kinase